MVDRRRDETIEAYLASFRLLGRHHAGSWQTWPARGYAGVTGAPIASMNGVVLGTPDFDAELAGDLLRQVRERGVPHSLLFPDRGADALAAVGKAAGLRRTHVAPLFRLDHLAPVPAAATVKVHELADDEAGCHAALAGAVFDAPPHVFDFVLADSYVADPGVRLYLATVDGEAVGTGMGVTHAGTTALFNVATAERARGRGVGTAVIHRIVADALAAGARFAYLQSSPVAVPLYERLGFRHVDDWQVWETP